MHLVLVLALLQRSGSAASEADELTGSGQEIEGRVPAGRGNKEDSPPVAKGGLLTNPATNLNIQNPAKLSTNAVGICNIQKMASGTMYGKFRPI